MKKKYLFRIMGMALFLIGVVLGMLLFGVSAWADLEAAFYGFEDMGGGRLSTVDCPVLMTTSEVGTVAAIFKNPYAKTIQYTVFADFSNRGLLRRDPLKKFSLDAHKSERVLWQVTSADIDMGNFIFAQVSNYPVGDKVTFRQATCGIMVLNLSQFTGQQVFTLAMIVIAIGIVGGLALWEAYARPLTDKLQETTRAMKTLGVLVMLGLLVSFQGLWMFGVLLFAAAVLAIGVILGFLLA